MNYFRPEKSGFRDVVTVVVEQKNHRLMDVVDSRTGPVLDAPLKAIPGHENVRTVSVDMSDSRKSFVRKVCPNAIVADKFHVLRLLTPAVKPHRKAITGDKQTNPCDDCLCVTVGPRHLVALGSANLARRTADAARALRRKSRSRHSTESRASNRLHAS